MSRKIVLLVTAYVLSGCASKIASGEKTPATRSPSSATCYALETQVDLKVAYHGSREKPTVIEGGLIPGSEKNMTCTMLSEVPEGSFVPRGSRLVGNLFLGGLGRHVFFANGIQITCQPQGWKEDSFINWPSPVQTINQAMNGKFYLDACSPYDQR